MISTELERELLTEVERLGPAAQRQVVDFARALAQRNPSDPTGKGILASAGAFAADDLAEMTLAIEAGCEQIDVNEW